MHGLRSAENFAAVVRFFNTYNWFLLLIPLIRFKCINQSLKDLTTVAKLLFLLNVANVTIHVQHMLYFYITFILLNVYNIDVMLLLVGVS